MSSVFACRFAQPVPPFATVEAGCLFPEVHARVTIYHEGDAHG
jgi:hypothetical protein